MAAANRLSPYAAPSATREVLERHGLYTKYALGQNFLVNDDVVHKIIDLAEVEAVDHVLEVGPGIGTLTSALLQTAGRVTSVEMDHDLPAVLQDTLAPWLGRFALIEMDALDLRREHLEAVAADTAAAESGAADEEGPAPFAGEAFATSGHACPESADAAAACPPSARGGLPTKLVSNLPYAVAATIVLDYLQRFDFLQSATVMVQKEVADRIMAKPGTKAYGAYTVKLGLVSQVAGRFPVAPGNFFPPPHVDSAVIRLDRRLAEGLACGGGGQDERSPGAVGTALDVAKETAAQTAHDLRTDASASDAPARELRDASASDALVQNPRDAAEGLLRATCTMADAAFATRRKTLANSCKTYFASQPDTLAALPDIFAHAGIDPRRRGETLEQGEFIALGRALLNVE